MLFPMFRSESLVIACSAGRLRLDSGWTLHGLLMDSSWTPDGLLVDSGWTPVGLRWTVEGLHQESYSTRGSV